MSENIDAMGIYGLYCAARTAGEGRDYTNADGEKSRLYGALRIKEQIPVYGDGEE